MKDSANRRYDAAMKSLLLIQKLLPHHQPAPAVNGKAKPGLPGQLAVSRRRHQLVTASRS
jgi:hypothetical protein